MYKREPIPLFIFFTWTQRERPTFTNLLPYESKHLDEYLSMTPSEARTLRRNPKGGDIGVCMLWYLNPRPFGMEASVSSSDSKPYLTQI